MRMSCNGCRVLRKGCSEDCIIRPCLGWMKTAEAQANATLFLAKFYGRAGLLNLVAAGPRQLRPGIFRSLLYESCGRIVNPVYGSVGLLWSGNWHLCQAAVEAVLRGAPVVKIDPSAAALGSPVPPLRAFDIRHVPPKDGRKIGVARSRLTRFKRSAAADGKRPPTVAQLQQRWTGGQEVESMFSGESAFSKDGVDDGKVEVELELTLGVSSSSPTSGGGSIDGGCDAIDRRR